MATNPKNQAEQAKVRSQELMDTNNAAAGSKSDQLLSILESGKGSSISRDLLDQYLHNYLEQSVGNHVRIAALNYDWATLRKCLSIKEKIAYITGLVYANEGDANLAIPLADEAYIDDTRLRHDLNAVIVDIETRLLSNRDFSESRILRNAAVNRFECKLTNIETNKLNEFANKVKEECKNNGLETLEESTHFTHESDAQKILKLSDVLIQMSAMGVKLDAKLLKEFEPLNEKIKPLKDLDKHYKHVTKTLNMLHRVAQKGYHAMVRPAQKAKVDAIIEKVGMTKTVNDELINFNKIENFDKNEEHTFLDNLVDKIKSAPKFQETIYSMSITEAQFNERFISSSAYILMQNAKLGLTGQKGLAFGSRLKDFEADTQSRRGMVRRRIFDIADNMGAGADFASVADFETANSYFNKFKDLFFAKEEDNYRDGPNADATLHYHKMEKVVSALVRRRVPALASSHRIRRGSAGRIVIKLIENALKQKDRGIYQRMRRTRHRADDATVVAMVLMSQNEATNQVFYQDQDKSKKADSRRGKLWGKIKFTENGRAAIRDRIGPVANKALTFTEEAVKKGLKLTKGATKVGNKIVSKTGRALTRSVGGLTGKFNTMIKKGYKRWKTPLYLPYIVTAGIEPLMKLGYKGSTYMDRKGGEHLDEVGTAVNKGYEETKDLVSKATGQETNYLFQGLTYATEQATSLVGKTVSAGGKRMHDNYSTAQQRSILGAFYGAAQEQKGLEDLMQSSELGEILNLKERGPYLFDEDGRVVTTERVETKEKNTPKEGAKELAKTLEKQLDILIKQIEEEVKEKTALQKKAIEENDDKKIQGADINLADARNKRNIINNLQTDIRNYIPILKCPTNPAGDRRHGEIETIGNNIDTRLNNAVAPIGILRTTRDHIGNRLTPGTLRNRLHVSQTALATATADVSTHQNTVKGYQDALKQKGANFGTIQPLLDTAIGLLQAAELEKARQEIEHFNISRELRNAENLLGRLELINEINNRIRDLNNRIHAALTATPPADTRPMVDEMLQLAKNMNILLNPEEKDKTDILNLKSITDEQRKKIEELLSDAA